MPNNNNKLQYLPTDIFTKYFEAYKICKDFWNLWKIDKNRITIIIFNLYLQYWLIF